MLHSPSFYPSNPYLYLVGTFRYASLSNHRLFVFRPQILHQIIIRARQPAPPRPLLAPSTLTLPPYPIPLTQYAFEAFEKQTIVRTMACWLHE